MPIRKYFVDRDGQELEVFINTKKQLTVYVGLLHDTEQGSYFSASISLTKEDVAVLIEEIQNLYSRMP